MKLLPLLLLVPFFGRSQSFTRTELARFKTEARQVTIIRDRWGIPHIYGKTDADAVFGCLYAQCEENFRRVEENHLEMMGRLSEINGRAALYDDLQMKLIYDSTAAKEDYKNAPAWMQKLLEAAADGVNYFLAIHPSTKPALLHRFEPWFFLMRTNGSISATQTGGLRLQDMMNLFKSKEASVAFDDGHFTSEENLSTGSNGFAVTGSMTSSKNAMIYINPHVSFYFRTEMQMVSEEGLNAYGAVTWGSFFIFQGFNEHCGWMHTTSNADVADLYQEKIEKKADSAYYLYDGKWLPASEKEILVRYREGNQQKTVRFKAYKTGHGPVMGIRDGRWLSLKENNRSLNALVQSWLRTKTSGFEDFRKVMEMRSNSSDNTVFADDKGNIAYWHGDFIPKRDPQFDWAEPVDGTTSKTEWQEIHPLDEIVHVYNPASGWIQNCNATPFTVAGESSPKKSDYPSYMAPDPENYRGINASRLLAKAKSLTMDQLIHDIGYSHYLSAFEDLLPPIFSAYDAMPSTDSLKRILAEPIAILKGWDRNSSDSSIATTLAIEWASKARFVNAPSEKIQVLFKTINELQKTFGDWKIQWGSINRYQRVAEGENFDDNKPSWPVGLASSTWGSLPSYDSRKFDTKKRYGFDGNSFVACVEFGKKIKAKSIVTGGQSFNPSSKNFTDQADGYINGQFKDVLFYKEDVIKNAARKYHPGE